MTSTGTSKDEVKVGIVTTRSVDSELDVDNGVAVGSPITDKPATTPETEREIDPEIAQLPLSVRQLVSLEDDKELFTITFRYFVLSIFFVVPGAFLSQLSHFRTTYAPYSIFFVQVACHYAGHAMERGLPAWRVHLPFGKSFSLNPGPWSIKEHVLVTLTAASGATYNLGYTPVSMAELYYGRCTIIRLTLSLTRTQVSASTPLSPSSSCWASYGSAMQSLL